MGQKIHPYGLRLGIIKTWQSRWYSKEHYREYLLEDEQIRKFVRALLKKKAAASVGRGGGSGGRDRFNDPALSRIEIERTGGRVLVKLHTARPGVVIGQRGKDIEDMQKQLSKMVGRDVRVTVEEVRQPNLDAKLVADSVAQQIERRVAFRRAMRMTLQRVIKDGAGGCRIECAGRLAGAEIARREIVNEGKVPRHTLRADIDYGTSEAATTYGNIGVKCWIYRGEIIGDQTEAPVEMSRGRGSRRRNFEDSN